LVRQVNSNSFSSSYFAIIITSVISLVRVLSLHRNRFSISLDFYLPPRSHNNSKNAANGDGFSKVSPFPAIVLLPLAHTYPSTYPSCSCSFHSYHYTHPFTNPSTHLIDRWECRSSTNLFPSETHIVSRRYCFSLVQC